MNWKTSFFNDYFGMPDRNFLWKYKNQVPAGVSISELIEEAKRLDLLEKLVDEDSDEHRRWKLVRWGATFHCFNVTEHGGTWASSNPDTLEKGVFTKLDKILTEMNHVAPDSKIRERDTPIWKEWFTRQIGPTPAWQGKFISDYLTLNWDAFVDIHLKKIPKGITIRSLIDEAKNRNLLEAFIDDEMALKGNVALVRWETEFRCYLVDERGTWGDIVLPTLEKGVFCKLDSILHGMIYAAPDSMLRNPPRWLNALLRLQRVNP